VGWPFPCRRTRAVFAALLACAWLAACDRVVGLPTPPDAVAMQPPAAYALWWRMAQACSGKSKPMSDVEWYYVPNATWVELGGHEFNGYWLGEPDRIVVAGHDTLAGDLVRHEMLHALIGHVAPGHPRYYFADVCAGIVACVDWCAQDAGGPALPPPTAPVVAPSALDVSVRIDSGTPSIGAGSGWIAVVVNARNPDTTGVWVSLLHVPGSPGANYTFGVIVRCVTVCADTPRSSWDYVWSGERFGIAAGATRREVWDLHLSPGVYDIRGYFSADTTAAVRLTVGR
jgi:hypothetical protein